MIFYHRQCPISLLFLDRLAHHYRALGFQIRGPADPFQPYRPYARFLGRIRAIKDASVLVFFASIPFWLDVLGDDFHCLKAPLSVFKRTIFSETTICPIIVSGQTLSGEVATSDTRPFLIFSRSERSPPTTCCFHYITIACAFVERLLLILLEVAGCRKRKSGAPPCGRGFRRLGSI